ncbi:Demethyldecarbamoylnovobiocin O-methyltransferase [BD1-7 clade bacterium]|uniref:Demethyldecarbamoylnovobiocin O-methyltransferase n=1 Tax=BD1-7 clade bacterium TaxID=2029982 RepID=A0A5S9PJZ5_9GAMM|nr:Demethyldecarbamoylnovobiocin O-methyltransferase [BD1-7 clade bacterium]
MKPVNLYLELLKRSLTNELNLEYELRCLYLLECINDGKEPDICVSRDIHQAWEERYQTLLYNREHALHPCKDNIAHFPHTLIGRQRLNNIEDCLDDIQRDNIPGDVIEAGVWRGGATIFMRGYLKAHNITNKNVWVADSFEGLPPSIDSLDLQYNLSKYHFLSINEETVRHNFKTYDLLDEKVRFLKGYFCDTLPSAEIHQLSLLRIDADMFESTIDVLSNLYGKLSVGGYVIIDDYGIFEPCRHAVDMFRLRHKIKDEIRVVDNSAIYWRKSA